MPCCSLPALADVYSYARNSGREGVRYFIGWHKVARCSSFSSKSLLQDEIEDAAAVSLRNHQWVLGSEQSLSSTPTTNESMEQPLNYFNFDYFIGNHSRS
jgi:hypothetical protein